MRFTEKNKFGKGRPPQSTNVVTAEIRESFSLLVKNNIDKLQNDLDSLESKDRINLLIQMSKFILPTLKAIDTTPADDNENFRPIVINLGSGINPDEIRQINAELEAKY